MADSFFGFDTSISNLNDDEGGGGPSEDEYDALNDETFGQDSDGFDWESQHEQLASEMESSRRHNSSLDHSQTQLEASLSKLVVDEPDSLTINPNVWRHDPPTFPTSHTPSQGLKNVCTVEELERQLRQSLPPQPQHHNYFQPRFPVILQRPPGLQAPVPLPFQQQQQNMTINQSLNKIIGQSNQNVNQMSQSYNPMVQNVNQMGQNVNQMGQNVNQMGQNMNQMGQNMNQMGQNMNKMGQNVNQLSQINQSMNQMTTFENNMMNLPIGQSQMLQQNNQMSQMGQNMSQMGQNMNQMGQNMNQMNHNPMMQNGNQFFPHMMGQSRMLAPQTPTGINLPRQSFSPNMGQFNPTFRGTPMPTKPQEQQTMLPQNMLNQQQQQMLQQHMQQNHSPQTIKQQSPPNKKPQNHNQNFQNHNQTVQNHNQTIQNHNQTLQNHTQTLQNQNQTLQNQQNQKLQKTRTYNNSQNQKGQNLTSQNLVQMIQNTHPMLQFNNSFHNASHHPMLNNRSNMYNNYNQMMLNRGADRLNGSFTSDNSMLNGDDESIGSEGDEYAGLMSQREKQWLINIQMLQLNTGTPYIHDYYYTVFLERQSKKEKEGEKEAHKANQQNHPLYSTGAAKQEGHTRERHNSVRHNSTSEERTYVPLQFENSLGKLQCGSVTAPRKIIDLEVVGSEQQSNSRAPSRASTHTPAEVPREMRRTKQLLVDIEALYLILLRIEELNDPLAISNALILKEREEKQKQLEAVQREFENDEDESNVFLRNIESVQKRPKQESPKSETVDKRQVVNLAVAQKPPAKNLLDEDKDDLINKMFAGLLHSDRLAQMLTVRKGRVLVSRFVSRVPPSHSCLRGLWARVLRALPSAARRDEGGLASLAIHYRQYVLSSSGWSAVLESCSHLSEALDPARTHTALMSSLTLSCVCSLVEKALTLVNTPDATPSERQWWRFLKTVARSLKHTTIPISRPLLPLSETKLLCHIKQLESRSSIEILQRGKSADFADVSKTEVSELLVKYLC